VLEGEGRRGRPRGDIELGEDVLQVPGDGVLTDDQHGGDFTVGLAGGDQAKHLGLAHGQPAGQLLAPAERHGRLARVAGGAEPLERGPSRAQLQHSVLIASGTAQRGAVQHPRLRGLVGQPELLPGRAGGAQAL
jgi:hypothetical protein